MGATARESISAIHSEVSFCPTCRESLAGQFCHSCGEQKFDRHSFSFRHFAHHAAHELFHLDSKILRTLRYLFTRPTYLTAEYLAGKKSRYVNPLRLYVLSFALVLLVNTSYRSPLDFKNVSTADKTGLLNKKLTKLAQKKGISEEQLLERMQERLHFYIEASKILNALVMTWLLAIAYYSKKWYFGEHAVTALYFLSFTSLLAIVKWPFWIALGAPLQGKTAYFLSLAFFVIALPYLWVMLRNLHGEGPWKTAFKSVLVYGGTQLTIIVTTIISFILAVLHTVLLS